MQLKKSLLTILILPITTMAAPLNISSTPLFLSQSVSPLTMLVMGRDHRLYYEAYNDASDLNGDGILDVGYNPAIDYYGYFDSHKCYSYSNDRFNPSSITSTKRCSGSLWSGDFLNYLTTSRIDALRKVLYGGSRSEDDNQTTLERSHIPQDAHSWGKEYRSIAVDGYDIRDYTPLSLPTSSRRHLFANTTLLGGDGKPLLRVANNVNYRVWEWLSIERPVAGDRVVHGGSGPSIASSTTDYTVRVRVCQTSPGLEENCRLYPNGRYKPIGILQEFGENDSMQFGLLSGSYSKNLSGGVLRKNIDSITNEIDPSNGRFTSTVGIIKTIDNFRITGFGSSHYYNDNCGWITTRDIVNGECRMWGNPIAEMMYEAVRYYQGKATPTGQFTYSGGDDASLGLPAPSWQDPYASSNHPRCAQPNMLVISDIYPSADTDEVPGSSFSSFSGDLSPTLNASTLGQSIWTQEFGGSRQVFIGEAGASNDGAPTPKAASSFGNIRGLVPEEPNKGGGYYSASVAYYGWLNDIHPVSDTQKLHTYVVALASPLPEINIPINGSTIKLIPFAKSVGGCLGVDGSGPFQPTNTIVDFYVESITPTSGTFRINFEDVQQGADHDMDAIVRYTYVVNSNNTVTVTLDSNYAAGCVQQHMGYVISGTTADGTYLEVRDSDTSSGSDPDYFLDTPPGQSPGGNWNDNQALPTLTSRTFTPGNNSAFLLKSPLWYAAKWGSFEDSNDNNIPDVASEYDLDNNGVPDNYFLVTNALNLKNQLAKAFNKITKRAGSVATATLNGSALSTNSILFQAKFNSDGWGGELLAFGLDANTGAVLTNGSGPEGSIWEFSTVLGTQNHNSGREMITVKPSTGNGIAFRWPSNPSSPSSTELDTSQVNALNLNPDTTSNDGLGNNRLNYIRGDTSQEEGSGGTFRKRDSLLGDIINSAATFVGRPSFPYTISWPTGSPEASSSYATFISDNAARTDVIYVGANDGVLHAIDVNTGREILGFVPSAVFNKLNALSSVNYQHQYTVDGPPNFGDVFYNSGWHSVLLGGLNAGGQSIYALDITDPSQFNETNANSLVLWEFSDTDDVDLGYTYSQPQIVRLNSGRWAAIFGNGYNNTLADGNVSATGNAVLYIVDIETGNLIKKFDTGVGASSDPLGLGRPNGLATPAVADMDGNYTADYVYVGDLFGNLWKIDISGSISALWNFSHTSGSTLLPFFVAQDDNGNRQAITTQPRLKKIPGTPAGLLVLFGTGKYLENSDKTDLGIQSFYGLHDFHSTQISRSDLLQQSIILEQTLTLPDSSTLDVRLSSLNALADSHRGWFMDFIYNNDAEGERVITQPIAYNEKIVFSTLIPSQDPCEYGGTGWLMELDSYSGARLSYSPFDLNQDDSFSSADNVSVTIDGETVSIPVSGQKSDIGVISSPAILTDTDKEHKYISGSSGTIKHITENPGLSKVGRQSWIQLR